MAKAKQQSRRRRGGHMAGHLREALLAGIERWEQSSDPGWAKAIGHHTDIDWIDPAKEMSWKRMSDVERARWLTGMLWNCTDSLGMDLSAEMSERAGRPVGSFAQAARFIRGRLSDSTCKCSDKAK